MTTETIDPPTKREPETLGQTVVVTGGSAGLNRNRDMVAGCVAEFCSRSSR